MTDDSARWWAECGQREEYEEWQANDLLTMLYLEMLAQETDDANERIAG